jgi:hypothetical protein
MLLKRSARISALPCSAVFGLATDSEQNTAAANYTDRFSSGDAMALAFRSVETPETFGKTSSSHFIVGQDDRGHWVAMDFRGREGGFFASREAALKYVAANTGRRSGEARFSAQPLALWK